MHSLKELYDFLISKEIQIKEFKGWYLKVGKDTWTMTHDVFYKNNEAQNLKNKNLFDKYKKVKQNVEHQSTDRRSSIKKIMSARIS